MKKVNKAAMTILLTAPVLFLGCVSTSKYKKLETDSKVQHDALAEKNQALEKELADQKQANAALNQQADDLRRSSEETKSDYSYIVGQLDKEVHEGNLQVTQYKNMLTVDVAEKLFFDSGSATLKKSGQEVLSKVGKAISQYTDKIIRVVGHTDNVPIAKAQALYPTNWELSVLRATTVVRYLQEKCQIKPENLIASGRGEYEPIAPNDTPENRQKNRRIEIMLLDKKMVETMQGQTR